MGAWSHQNAYRRKRYLEQTLGRTLIGEQLRTDPATGRRRCWARYADTNKRCPNAPMAGMDVCIRHGGKAPQARRLAAIRFSWVRAFQVTRTLGDMLDRTSQRDPREVLLQQVHEAATMAAATRELVGQVDVEALQNPNHENHAQAAQTHELFSHWNERALKSAKAALDIGIDESMVKLAEMQAKAMVRLVKEVLGADVLQLSATQQQTAQKLLAKGLRDLMPGVESTPTVMLHVDGEDLPYNQAMDQFVGNTQALSKAHQYENYLAGRNRRAEELRMRTRSGSSSLAHEEEGEEGGDLSPSEQIPTGLKN